MSLKTEGFSWKSVPQPTSPSLFIEADRKGKKERGTKHQEGQRKTIFKKSHFHSQIYATLSVGPEDEQLNTARFTSRTNITLLKKVKAEPTGNHSSPRSQKSRERCKQQGQKVEFKEGLVTF